MAGKMSDANDLCIIRAWKTGKGIFWNERDAYANRCKTFFRKDVYPDYDGFEIPTEIFVLTSKNDRTMIFELTKVTVS